jgi:ribosomal protein L20A (L18A)
MARALANGTEASRPKAKSFETEVYMLKECKMTGRQYKRMISNQKSRRRWG